MRSMKFFNSAEEESSLLQGTRGNHKFSEKEKNLMASFQSLDFTVIDNRILHEYNRKKTKQENNLDIAGKWFLSFWIGVIIGCVAYVIKKSVEVLGDLKFKYTEPYLEHGHDKHNLLIGYLVYSGICLGFAIASTLVIIIFRQPLAAGSGIPEVKGYLNGVRIPNSINVRTLLSRVVSLVLSFSSGLILGPEGPMIHIGSMIGAAVGQVKSKSMKWYPRIFWRYHNDRDRRDFISSGAAAGVAAAFGAPIGGVLFSIEEASSFWSPQLTWRTFFTCLMANFTVSLLGNRFSSMVEEHGILFFGLSQFYVYRIPEILAFIILAMIGGVLGAAFVSLNVKLNRWRNARLKNKGLKMLEVVVVTLVTSALAYWISIALPCKPISDIKPTVTECYGNYSDVVVYMDCPSGYYSDAGSLLFNSPDRALQILYSRTQELLSIPVLAIACIIFFILSILTSGLYLSGGLFIPMMLVGATLGRMYGKILVLIFSKAYPPIDASVYALIGTAAVMAGFCRMTIALVVILVELTEGTQYLLPVILTVMVSKWMGDVFTEAHYEHMMETKAIPYLDTYPPQAMMYFTVAEVMKRDVIYFTTTVKVSEVLHVIQHTKHGGFPVVQKDDSVPSKHVFRGMILRNQLIILLTHKIFSTSIKSENYTDLHISSDLTHEEFTEALARKIPDEDTILATAEEMQMLIDLRPYMNVSATVVHDTCSYTEAYRLFRTMGLRHLVVVGKHNQVVGIITRKDLL